MKPKGIPALLTIVFATIAFASFFVFDVQKVIANPNDKRAALIKACTYVLRDRLAFPNSLEITNVSGMGSVPATLDQFLGLTTSERKAAHRRLLSRAPDLADAAAIRKAVFERHPQTHYSLIFSYTAKSRHGSPISKTATCTYVGREAQSFDPDGSTKHDARVNGATMLEYVTDQLPD